MTETIDYIARARALDKQIHNLKAKQVSDTERIETIAGVLSSIANEKSVMLINAARTLAHDASYENPRLQAQAIAVLKIVGDRK